MVERVERVLYQLPQVAEAAVVGVPDERWGERVTAVVVLAAGGSLSYEELRAHCLPFLADYKIPKAVVVAPEIVRSPSGKPDYEWAKQHATDASRAS